MFLLYKPTFTAEQIVGQVQEEIAKLQNEPVDAKELERVKTQVRAGAIKDMQSSLTRARSPGAIRARRRQPGLINTELDRVLAVTPAQIQAAAKKYLTPDRAQSSKSARARPGPEGGKVNVAEIAYSCSPRRARSVRPDRGPHQGPANAAHPQL